MKFFIRTLGCKMNWLDSARTSALLQNAGHQPAESEAEAEVVLVNSCTVTAEADRKSRQVAGSLARGGRWLGVMGCAPRVDPEEWQRRLPQAALFHSETELLKALGVEEPAEELLPATDGRTRLPVAIQQGCDDLCTFCITRVARGGHRSVAAQSVVRQVREAAEQGVGEVILTGINLGAWGCSDSREAGESRLHQLLERLLEETEIPRIRLSSIGPQYVTKQFCSIFSDTRIADHLHLSVQSGSSVVLQRMARGHGVDEIRRAVHRARRARPDMAVGADLIAGFPGESEEEFRQSCELVEELTLSHLHVFPYSPRSGTPAAGMPRQLPTAERKRRATRLRELGRSAHRRFLASQEGRMRRVLVERGGSGLTGNYIRLRTPPEAAPGEFVKLRISSVLCLDGGTGTGASDEGSGA